MDAVEEQRDLGPFCESVCKAGVSVSCQDREEASR
jgi:hypothetical protein